MKHPDTPTAAAIRTLRGRRQETQGDFARRVGISLRAIHIYEKGQHAPAYAQLALLAHAAAEAGHADLAAVFEDAMQRRMQSLLPRQGPAQDAGPLTLGCL